MGKTMVVYYFDAAEAAGGAGGAGSSFYYERARLKSETERTAPEHTKTAQWIKDAREWLKATIDDSATTFADDFENQLFLENSSLERALKAEITKETREPGVVIVLSPKDSGKTTRMARVIRTLTEENKIAGGYRISPNVLTHYELPVMDALSASIKASPRTCFFDLLPATRNPIIFVIDSIDMHSNNEAALLRLKELAENLSRESVAPGNGIDFQIYALTSSNVIAETLLTINGGRKVRLLGYGDEIVGGNKMYDAGTWSREGLKLGGNDVEKLVRLFMEKRKLTLNEDTLATIKELGVKSGTPGFIRDVCSVLADKIHDEGSRSEYLQNEATALAEKQEKEWQECAQVKKP